MQKGKTRRRDTPIAHIAGIKPGRPLRRKPRYAIRQAGKLAFGPSREEAYELMGVAFRKE